MKAINFIISVIQSVYSFSADPNLFGSKNRRLEKENLANEFKGMADTSQENIDQIRSQNPFESAAARSAMTKASRNAKQMQTRMLRTMGANASPEALVSSTGQVNQALGATAGSIATGAEANRNSQINALQGQKAENMGRYGALKTSSIDEIGQGWKDLFANLDGIEALVGGAGQIAQMAAGLGA